MSASRTGAIGTISTLLVLGAAFLAVHGCDNGGSGVEADADGDADGDGDGDSDGDGDGDAGNDGGWDFDADGPIVQRDGGIDIEEDGGSWTCFETVCDGHMTECGDCVDNDEDGLVDSHDPECLGPCDNTEGPALTTGVGGERGGPCRADCYFDYGNGDGNDDCQWDSRCDPFSVAPYFDPEGEACEFDPDSPGTGNCPDEQSDLCLEVCMPLTPNGCDCFGCCTFPALAGRSTSDGGEYVWLGSVDEDKNGTCTFADILDRSLCRPCSPVADCWNDCGPCELCLGRDELPPECFEDPPDAGPGDGGTTDGGTTDAGSPPGPRCPDELQPCGLDIDPPCPEWHYCITGCCQQTVY